MTVCSPPTVRALGRILFYPGSTGIFSVGGVQTRGAGRSWGGPGSSGSSADQREKTCRKQLCYCGGRRRNVMEPKIRSHTVQRQGSPAGRGALVSRSPRPPARSPDHRPLEDHQNWQLVKSKLENRLGLLTGSSQEASHHTCTEQVGRSAGCRTCSYSKHHKNFREDVKCESNNSL